MGDHESATTDWRFSQWTTKPNNHATTSAGPARVVWSVHPATDVAYVLPTDGHNGNVNAMLISMAPDIARCLLLASTCLRDCPAGDVVKTYVSGLKRLLDVDAAAAG